MPVIRAGSVQLHFVERAGPGEAVVFVHGFTSSWRKWREVLERLPAHLRGLAFDLRGAGDSDRPGGGYDIGQYAEDVHLATLELGLGPFTFVGHSLGGAIGLTFALQHRERLKRLVLVAPTPADGNGGNPAELERRNRARRDAAALLDAKRSRLVRPRSERVLAEEVDDNHKWDDAAYRGAWESMASLELEPELARIEVPTLMILGDRDPGLAAQLRDAQRIPRCGLQVFQRVGHEVAADVPDAFVEVLVDFVG